MSNTAQGTRLESYIVAQAKEYGMAADRLPKRAVAGEPDLFIGVHPTATMLRMPVLIWKRLVRKDGRKRRSPSGVGKVVVLEFDDFMELAYLAGKERDYSFLVQAKATQVLSVTNVLHSVKQAIKKIWHA